jgi:uncharacterized protein YjbI with pentapeptide repeats
MAADKPRSLISRWLLIEAPWIKNPPPTAAGIATAFLLILGAGTAFVIFVLLARLFGRVFGADIPTEELRNILIVVGALVGAPFLVWRTWVAHVAARADDEQAKIARESLYTSLFTKAVEQLGTTREVKETKTVDGEEKTISRTEPNIEVRLGAIYALERIAQDSERDHWPIMETLCAYVRNNAGLTAELPDDIEGTLDINKQIWPQQEKNPAKWIDKLKPMRTDVQAALTVVGRRSIKRVSFEHQLAQTTSNKEAYRLNLSDCNLNKAILRGLNFDHARFDRSSLIGAKFHDAQICGAWFLRSRLVGVTMERAVAIEAFFADSDLRAASLWSADMAFANFLGCRLNNAGAIGTSFDGSMLQHMDIRFCDLTASNLAHVRFNDVTFSECIFDNANLLHTQFDYCTLSGSIRLSLEQINKAVFRGLESPFGKDSPLEPAHWTGDGSLNWPKSYDVEGARHEYTKLREAAVKRSNIFI